MTAAGPDAVGDARRVLAGLAARAAPRPGRVTLDLSGPTGMLLLDNPTARGALTLAMMVQLAEAVEHLAAWDGAALVVASTDGEAFCAGGHLDELIATLADRDAALAMSNAMTAVLDALLDLPLVSVAAVGGACIGGGAELITACDHRVAGTGAAIRFVQARLGIAPGWGGASRLVKHVGRRSALRLLTSGDGVSAAEARALGLVDAVDPDPRAAALRFLEPVLAAPPAAVRACKRQVVTSAGSARHLESEAFAELWGGPAHRAALERMGRRR